MNNVFNFNSRTKNVSLDPRRFKTDRERAAEKNGSNRTEYSERLGRVKNSLSKINNLMTDLHNTAADTVNSDAAPTVAFKPSKIHKERTITRISGMVFQPLKQQFKASSGKCTFNLETQEAYSYGWWRFVERIGPYLVFNSYSYSVTTSKHQREVRWLLEELGLTIDLEIAAPQGLRSLTGAVDYYRFCITQLEKKITTKGTKKAKNVERRAEIVQLQIRLATVQMLMKVQNSDKAMGF